MVLVSGDGRRFDDADAAPHPGDVRLREIRAARVGCAGARGACAAVRPPVFDAMAARRRGHVHAARRAQRPRALRARRLGDDARLGAARSGTGAACRLPAARLPAEAPAFPAQRGRRARQRPAPADAAARQSLEDRAQHAQGNSFN